MVSKAKLETNARWNNKHVRKFTVTMYDTKDAAAIAWLESRTGGIGTYIRELIRADMEAHAEKKPE